MASWRMSQGQMKRQDNELESASTSVTGLSCSEKNPLLNANYCATLVPPYIIISPSYFMTHPNGEGEAAKVVTIKSTVQLTVLFHQGVGHV